MSHLATSTGNEEWYTPLWVLEHVKTVFGGVIDLDPASNPKAAKNVDALLYYTKDDDGLKQDWIGTNVFMNPPYSRGVINQFVDKLITSSSYIGNAIVITNNSTSTQWGQQLLRHCSAVCFPSKRIKFISPNGEKGAPLQGQMITYFSFHINKTAKFKDVFSSVGVVL